MKKRARRLARQGLPEDRALRARARMEQALARVHAGRAMERPLATLALSFGAGLLASRSPALGHVLREMATAGAFALARAPRRRC